MNSVLETLSNLSKSPRLVAAEQILMTNVSHLDKFLVDSLSEEDVNTIEQILFSLFSVNKSDFSIQCSLYIASFLLKLYKIKKNPQVYEVINLAISNSSPPTIFCAGFIIRHMGGRSKAQIPHFIDFLLRPIKITNATNDQQQNVDFASLYALRCCFKATGSSFTQYMKPAFDFLKKTTSHAPQSNITIGIKLMKEMVKSNESPVLEIFDMAKYIYNTQKFPLLHDDIANLVARCAFSSLYPNVNKKMKEKTDWTISNFKDSSSELDEPLEMVKKFGKLTKNIMRHFLNMLTTTMIARSSLPLFNFLRRNCQEMLSNLIPVLPADTKFNLFTEISKEEPVSAEQLQLLIMLCPDSRSISEAAGVALLLSSSSSDDKAGRNAANEFFTSFSKSHPIVTLSYLRASLVFLAQPPEFYRNIENDIHGNACIVYTILSNIPRVEDALIPNKKIIKNIIDDVFTNPDVTSIKFSDTFKLLSILPRHFCKNPKVTDAVVVAADFLMSASDHTKKWRNLLKNVFAFRSKFIEIAQNNLLVVVALQSNEANLPRSVLVALEKLVPISANIEGWASDAVRRVIESAAKISPNQNLAKKFVMRPLPTGNDLLKYKALGYRKEQKLSNYLEQMVKYFPTLFNSCQLKEKNVLIKTLVSSRNPSVYLLLLEMFNQFPQKMPKRAYTVLLQKIDDKNLMTLEIISETIAIYYNYDNSILPVIFEYIEKNNSHGCCVLLSAIFSHAEIQSTYITRAIILLNSYMKTSSAVPFAVHAITSMFLRHSMELTNLGITLNEFSVLFETLNRPISLQPVVLHLCSEMFSLLIEINSSNIKDFENLINLSLQSIKHTPIDYSKEAYLNCSRSIITFSHQLLKYTQISFPSSICTSTSLELTACSTFSDLLKFDQNISKNLKLQKTMKFLLALLQKTTDDRASEFIVSLSSVFTDDLDFWIGSIRRILLGDSLFDNNTGKIEPNPVVKVSFLEVCINILPILSARFDLKTEYIDDIIAAICKAIETERVKIQEAAYPVLKKLIELFRNRRSENGGRLLDLYDVQFVSAVKIGFSLNLSISGGFLSTYLSFHTAIITEETFNNDILDVYVSGLQNCQQRSTNYYSLVLDLCIVARKFGKIADQIKPFLINVVPIFADTIWQSMKIKPNDWQEMAKFRGLVSTFYEDLPSSFVWLQKLTDSVQIDVNALVSFFIIEFVNSREIWKRDGALNAIPVAFQYFGDEIKPELLDEAIKVIANSPQEIGHVSEILVMASRLIKENDKDDQGDDNYDNLRENILSLSLKNEEFIPEIFAHLLYKDRKGRKLREYSVAVGLHLIIQIQKGFNATKVIPVFRILFCHSPGVIGLILSVILTKLDSKYDDFKMKIITIGLTNNVVDHIPLKLIGRFAVQGFESFGIQMVSSILLKNGNIGISILSENVAKVSFLLAANDIHNCRYYLRFIHLCLQKIVEFSDDQTNSILVSKGQFVKSVLELIFEVIKKFANDPQLGPPIVVESVSTLKYLRANCLTDFNEFYEETDNTEKELIISLLQRHVVKAELRNKNSHLTVFSGNARTSKYDEWQTLSFKSSDDDE